MAEGDTVLRAAQRLEAALAGESVEVRAGNGRGRSAGVERLDGRRLDSVEARGKHLILQFGELVLHSHLGMSGAWHVYRRGERWRRPRPAAWAVLAGEGVEAVQFGGPTLRVLKASRLANDPVLSRLGPDVLAADFDAAATAANLCLSPERELGDALLDQHLVAGIGNIFKSEACFAARVDPWRPIGELSADEARQTLEAARRLMQDAVASGRPPRAVYRRSGQPCPQCGTRIGARGQGDSNRRTYWCPRCQAPEAPGRAS